METHDGAVCYRERKMKDNPTVIVVKFQKKDDKMIWIKD
jgi:hypothetical protein